MIEIDDAITQIEKLYHAITGMPVSSTEAAYAPIPPERDPVIHVQEQVERLLQALSTPVSPISGSSPPVSVQESGTEYVLLFDVPGVSRERVEVTVRGNMLVISGERPGPTANGHRLTM